MLLMTDQYQDRRRMMAHIASRIPEEGIEVVLAEGEGGDVCVQLDPVRYEDGKLDLRWETNEPEWVDLREIYEHFRRQELPREQEANQKRLVSRRAINVKKPEPPSLESERQNATTLTVKDAAKRLNMSPSFVYKLMSNGELSYERRGRRKLPTSESVAEYRRQNTVLAHAGQSCSVKPPRTNYQFKYLFQRKKTRKGGN